MSPRIVNAFDHTFQIFAIASDLTDPTPGHLRMNLTVEFYPKFFAILEESPQTKSNFSFFDSLE